MERYSKLSWFDFAIRARGYQFERNGRIIPKYILYEKIKNRDDIEAILEGKSNEYKRVNSDGWRDGMCYFYWRLNSVTGQPYKEYTTMPIEW